jgi:hypothetical protein
MTGRWNVGVSAQVWRRALRHSHQVGERVSLHFLHHLNLGALTLIPLMPSSPPTCLSAGQEAQGTQADGITECRWYAWGHYLQLRCLSRVLASC